MGYRMTKDGIERQSTFTVIRWWISLVAMVGFVIACGVGIVISIARGPLGP